MKAVRDDIHTHDWDLISDIRSGPVFNKVYVCDCNAIKEITGEVGKANPEILITENN